MQQEGQILLAISAIKNCKKLLSIYAAACLYNVPLTSLYNQFYSTIVQAKRHLASHKLIITKEETLL